MHLQCIFALMTTQELITSKLFDEWAKNQRGESMAKGHDPIFDPVLEAWDLNADSMVLDVGCGVGRALWRAGELGAAKLAGIDLAPEMIAAATSKLPEADLQTGSILELPWDKGSFTHVLSIEVLYYLEHPVAGLQEIWRVLKPGGRFDMVIEFFAENHASKVWEDILPMKIQNWAEEKWAKAFKEAGFSSVKTQRIVRASSKTQDEFTPSDSFPSWEMYSNYVEQGALWVSGKC